MRHSFSAFLVLALCSRLPAQVDVCATAVNGFVDGVVWTKAQSPYRVGCDLFVGVLTIQPGVRVEFEGNYGFEVRGTLTARGTATDPITFTTVDPSVTWKGILFDNTQPGSELKHCLIERANTSGIRLIQSVQTIEDCVIRYNSTGGEGGGIFADLNEGDLTLKTCAITGNWSASHGGGLRAVLASGTLRLEGCLISGNTANPGFGAGGNYVGGGIYVAGKSEIVHCLVIRNEVRSCAQNFAFIYSRGGGMFSGGKVTVRNSIFRGNVSRGASCGALNNWAGYGAGLFFNDGELEIQNCIFSENASANGNVGSGLFVNSGTANVVNSTFVGNNTQGIHLDSGACTVLNSILYFNYGSTSQLSGNVLASYSCIQGGYQGEGNGRFNPVFADLVCLRITPGSPCVDAGHPALAYDDACFPPSLGTPRNDMGAYGGPLACSWSLPFDCNKNCIPDSEDIASGTSRDCNLNGIPDECDIASGVASDTNGDRIIDSCINRSVRIVPVPGKPLTYMVKVTSDVRFRGGELAMGLDPAVLKVKQVTKGPQFPSDPDPLKDARLVLCPPDCAGGLLSECPQPIGGVTIGWVNPQSGTVLSNPGTYDLFEIALEFVPDPPPGKDSPLEFVYCLGGAPGARVTNTLTGEDGRSLPLIPFPIVISNRAFIRGDANDDGRFDISDPVSILACLFAGAICPPCRKAADANDSGVMDISDAVYLLQWRFQSGDPPPPPYPGCQRDPTDDTLPDCDSRSCL